MRKNLDATKTAGSTIFVHRRPDIQGLRAIAVLIVVAFHAGLPVPGGFVGVDVFFVISGFVITAMLQREWVGSGRIRFRQFYLKRFKRLTPALALVVAATMIASAVVLSPLGPQESAAKTGVGAMLLFANFAIARSTGGYFDPAAETNPLLNTWSLSVEEQFYLVFPAIIVFGWYLARRTARLRSAPFLLISAIAAVSFLLVLAGMFEVNLPAASWILGFYSPFTRAWEFAVGALLALALARVTISLNSRVMLTAGVTGLVMLVASLWLISETTTFPGPWTLLPVVGTLLLIFAGTQDNCTSRSLSVSPLVRLGDWSYSIYLWHWPLIVFAIYIWPFSSFVPILAATISVVPAVASYYLLEQPIRKSATVGRAKIFKLVALVTIPPLILAVLLGLTAERYWQPKYLSGGIPALYENDGNWSNFYAYLSNTYFPCSDPVIRENALKWEEIERCWQSKPDASVDVAIIGDSHAEHLFLGLAERLPTQNVAYYIQNSLPIRDGAAMSLILEKVENDPSIQTVIVNGNWIERGIPEIELTQTLEGLVAASKQVFITDDVPVYPYDSQDCLFGASRVLSITRCSQDIDYFRANYSKYYPTLERIVRNVSGVQLLNSAKYFCSGDSCKMTYGDQMLYRDYNHLNSLGSRYIIGQLLEDYPEFKKVLTTS